MFKYLLLLTFLLGAGCATAEESKLPVVTYELSPSSMGTYTEVHDLRPFHPAGKIKIENLAGKVTVIGWERNEIDVNARLGEHVERLRVDIDEDNAKIEVVLPNWFKRNNKAQSEVIIHVPMQSTIHVESVSSAINISNVQGRRHEIETVSGAVKISNVQGGVKIETVSGKAIIDQSDSVLDIETVSGYVQVIGTPTSVDIETVSGAVQVSQVQNWASVETVSGKITVQGTSVAGLDLSSHSGTITYTGGLQEHAEIDIETFSASVNLSLDAPYTGDYKLQTFSGKTHIEFPEKSYGPSKNISMSHGDGDRNIRAETFSGNIHISGN